MKYTNDNDNQGSVTKVAGEEDSAVKEQNSYSHQGHSGEVKR
jgi:hypothetical protein